MLQQKAGSKIFLGFEVTWTPEESCLTWSVGQLYVGGQPMWGPEGAEWDWRDLGRFINEKLEYLTSPLSGAELELLQNPDRIYRLCRTEERYILTRKEDNLLFQFQLDHDFMFTHSGIDLTDDPTIFTLGEHTYAITEKQTVKASREQARKDLEEIRDLILRRSRGDT